MISAADLDNKVDDIEVVSLRTPTTTKRNFDDYVNGLLKVKKIPTCAGITRITFDEDCDWEKLEFTLLEEITNEDHLEKILQKVEGTEEILLQPYDITGYKEAKEAFTRKRSTRKKKAPAPKKKSSVKKKRGKSKFSR